MSSKSPIMSKYIGYKLSHLKVRPETGTLKIPSLMLKSAPTSTFDREKLT